MSLALYLAQDMHHTFSLKFYPFLYFWVYRSLILSLIIYIRLNIDRGSLNKYDDDAAWWHFAKVANYAYNCYEFAMRPVRALQEKLDTEIYHDVEKEEEKALKKYSEMLTDATKYTNVTHHEKRDEKKVEKKGKEAVRILEDFSKDRAKKMIKEWKGYLFYPHQNQILRHVINFLLQYIVVIL